MRREAARDVVEPEWEQNVTQAFQVPLGASSKMRQAARLTNVPHANKQYTCPNRSRELPPPARPDIAADDNGNEPP
jgi:hypothetical protein